MKYPAILVLADGNVFHGESIGATGLTVGEVVFNTAMTGYQEILTDPSYARQLVTLTYPHIGNVGVNIDDSEASEIFAAGLIIRDLPLLDSNWRSQEPLDNFLQERGIVAISNIDTRRLTRILREHGTQTGCIVTCDSENERCFIEKAQQAIQAFAGLKGMDLAKEVSTQTAYQWHYGDWDLANGYHKISHEQKFNVVVYDFGVKRMILRLLVARGCDVTVVPAQTPAAEVLAMQPDGVFLSNGPGDPAPCIYAIDNIKIFLEKKMPLFGICLGHQLLAIASGAKTEKMPVGHHGANHPVKDLKTGQVLITSQNHGFSVNKDSLPAHLEATHYSLFDHSLQGIRHTQCPAFSFQGHPEASPGPHDVSGLFDQFIDLMRQFKTQPCT